MRKFLLIFLCFIFLCANAQTLKATISKDIIPRGFFGSWGVISKLEESNNPTIFNYESRDIWTLSGYQNILVLENLQSGARSEIEIKEKPKDGKTLKFEREKIVENGSKKTIYKETVEFTLLGNNFSGTDSFKVERYENNKYIKTDEAKYLVAGIRISGTLGK